jgi:RNA polymerase sigma-70 factor (ECF subfamily)
MQFSNARDLRDMEDEDVLEHVAAGHQEGLTVLMERYSPMVLGVARHILQDRGEAQDMVQDVFGEVCESAGRFDRNKGTFKTWLFRITRNLAINRRKYLQARQFYSNSALEDMEELPDRTGFWLRFARQEQPYLIRELLAILKPVQRTTVELKCLEGLSVPQVAEQTGKSVGAVENNLRRALKKLRRAIDKQDTEPSENNS